MQDEKSKVEKSTRKKEGPVVDGSGHDGRIFGGVDDFLWPPRQDSSQSLSLSFPPPLFFFLSHSVIPAEAPGNRPLYATKLHFSTRSQVLMDN